MSYSFRTNATTLPSLRSLFENAGVSDVVCRQEIDLDQDWSEGVLHFYRPNISCRVIEVIFEKGTFDVRIMANSSEDDYENLCVVDALSDSEWPDYIRRIRPLAVVPR